MRLNYSKIEVEINCILQSLYYVHEEGRFGFILVNWLCAVHNHKYLSSAMACDCMDGKKKKNHKTHHNYPDTIAAAVVEARETLRGASGKALLGKGTWEAAHSAGRNLRRLQRLESK